MLKTKPKILFIRAGALGDVLMITPVIRRVHAERNGDCEIYVATFYPDIFNANPWVVNSFKPDNFQYSHFDIIYNLDSVYEKNNDRHVLDAYEEYVFGSVSNNRHCELFDQPEDIEYVNSLIFGMGDFIVLHMRSITNTDPDHTAKNIDENIWRDVATNILNSSSVKILQIGGPTDLCFGGNDRLIDLRQKLSIHQIKSLCQLSKCYLGTDSGPAHLAATSNVNMIVLYTIAKIDFFKPFRFIGKSISIKANIACQGCLINIDPGDKLNCQYNVQCRKSFSAEEISNKVLDLIS